MALTEERSRAIASRISELMAKRGPGRGSLSRALLKARQLAITGGPGPTWRPEGSALESLVASGELSREEAQAYLSSLYPAERWSGGRFGDQERSLFESEQAERQAFLRGGRRVRRSRTDPVLTEPPQEQVFNISTQDVPDAYDAAAIKGAFSRMATEVSENLRMLRASPPEPMAYSLDGIALKPGSVPAEALEPEAFGQSVRLPGADEAVEIEASQSATMDRFVVNSTTAISGPGRILEAQPVAPSSTARIGSGPTRYRVVRPDMRFGVMSMRIVPTGNLVVLYTPGMLIQYGVVITKIPHWLGRPPREIIGVDAVGNPPVALARIFADGNAPTRWTAAQDFFWSRTQSEYEDQGNYPYATVFGSDAVLAPVADNLRLNQGFIFHLVVGRDANEVFQQLCSRFVYGNRLEDDGRAAVATVPRGLTVESPAPPNCLAWDTGAAKYAHMVETDNLTAQPRIVQGIPFSYDDCAAMVPTDTHFSLVVVLAFERTVSQSPAPSPWGTPEVWHRNGVKTQATTSGRLRTWAVDVIVN